MRNGGTDDRNIHWLDRRFPGIRLWLEDKNREWWIKGLVQARCKQYHQLERREQQLRSLIEHGYVASMQQYSRQYAVDERAETHLQVAALALATHKALLPFLRDEQEVLRIVREHMGGRTEVLLRLLQAATKFLHRDGYVALTARLRGLQTDLGSGFASQLELGSQESSLTIKRCFYHSVFVEAGQPQLAATCCCSQDKVWFETAFKGVEAGRSAAISSGDSCCRFFVRRVP
ncbi:hypothetical protein D9Q98_002873 [Chlorella vulgaris]|uniref:L-2-amino-thiazoline-4-carboxylic acid hydrolase n=1 Tax=Chlorella vulgaris TaxID=3077 RepID=A0A9D4TU91_CHLVU|nr:hypothetical protein D9Q98_002873 [Chlorella vulgaris]